MNAKEKAALPPVARIEDPKMLPKAAFMVMFARMRILYKGQLLVTSIITSKRGRLLRAIEVGDYLYIEQEKFEQTHWAAMARKGHGILWIVHRPTAELVGKVVDGKVTKF